ncbi:MAG: hypothetical protein D6762_07980 [Candidatus Neomarinimicrobiota bacterium]|nr:MAG: hypothetical protein D6762_07980 [Candidatus Neomarinimicrobiota bacterium]
MKKWILAWLMVSWVFPKKIVIKLATLAPEGTDLYGQLVDMQQQWKAASNGEVMLRIYPNGVVGDERDMIRKMRIGQIQAAGITTEGLSELAPDVYAFIMPMYFRSYEDVDRVRDVISRELEDQIEANGFKLLYWADIGWAYWFTDQEIHTPDDLRELKIFTWAGDFKSRELWKSAGFQSVSLASTDVLSGLQTGLIDAVATTPLFALSSQWFGVANHLLLMKWGLVTAALVVDLRTWNQIPEAIRPRLLDIAHTIGRRHQATGRFADQQAIDAMKQYGLTVVVPTPEEEQVWRHLVRSWYPALRGTFVSDTMYDLLMELDTVRVGDE